MGTGPLKHSVTDVQRGLICICMYRVIVCMCLLCRILICSLILIPAARLEFNIHLSVSEVTQFKQSQKERTWYLTLVETESFVLE